MCERGELARYRRRLVRPVCRNWWLNARSPLGCTRVNGRHTMDVSERNFEESIERALLAGGPDAQPGVGTVAEQPASYGDLLAGRYRKRDARDYDRAPCLIPPDLFAFLYAPQPEEGGQIRAP